MSASGYKSTVFRLISVASLRGLIANVVEIHECFFFSTEFGDVVIVALVGGVLGS